MRRGEEDFLIELMEGVEDIPGTALHEGIDWRWESFREYLDALAAMPRVLDVAAQVPHCALRAYVLGDRAHDLEISADEIAAMARLTEEAVRAGAVGFTTSRTILHRSKHGLVPGTHSTPEELLALGRALGAAGHGVFEMVVRSAGPGARSDRGCASSAAAPAASSRSRWRRRRCSRRRGATRWRGSTQLAAEGLQHRAAGAVPTDRHALRSAELAAPVHLASDLQGGSLAALPLDERVARMRDAGGARASARRGAVRSSIRSRASA